MLLEGELGVRHVDTGRQVVVDLEGVISFSMKVFYDLKNVLELTMTWKLFR